MKKLMILALVPWLLVACGGGGEYVETSEAPAAEAPLLEVEAPEPIEVPALMEVAGPEDWAAKVNNKNAEVIGVINVINPVAGYIVAGFEQYGDSFSEILHEEWEDTQAQLGQATTLYDSCKQRMGAEEYDRQLFLDLEEVWQILVKTGVAGVRTKSMVDSELGRLKG